MYVYFEHSLKICEGFRFCDDKELSQEMDCGIKYPKISNELKITIGTIRVVIQKMKGTFIGIFPIWK